MAGQDAGQGDDITGGGDGDVDHADEYITAQTHWAAGQLDAAGLVFGRSMQIDLVRRTVLSLMDVYTRAEFDAVDPGGRNGVRDQAMKLFMYLADGHALPSASETYTWRSARNFAPSIGQVARVKLDAYQGDRGRQFNGRVGRVVHLRRGVGLMFEVDVEPRGGTFPPADVEVAM